MPMAGERDLPPSWRVAHVAQETPAVERTALEYALDGDTRLREIEAQIAAAQAAHDGHAEAEAHIAFADADGYTAPPAPAPCCWDWASPSPRPASRWRASPAAGACVSTSPRRSCVLPICCCWTSPPTTWTWTPSSGWKTGSSVTPARSFIISHDREFLDGICDVTLHVENRSASNVTAATTAPSRARAPHSWCCSRRPSSASSEKSAHLQSFVDRFRYKASKARQAQSRIKMLEKMEQLAPVHVSFRFSFEFRDAALRRPTRC